MGLKIWRKTQRDVVFGVVLKMALNIDRKRVNQMLAGGLILESIFIIIFALQQESLLLKLSGLIGGIIVIIVESAFLLNVLNK